MELDGLKVCVVGAGFFGAVIAERVSRELGLRVLVIDRRDHIGGNAFSTVDRDSGVEVHQYGSHIFHTRDKRVWDYLSQFTSFNSYRHRVWTRHAGRIYTMPINLGTINAFYGRAFSPDEARAFVAAEIARDRIDSPRNLEEQAISLVGRPLYEAFIRGYSEKQWETPLTELPASIITRLPVRFTFDDRYFDDPYEGIPTDGYTRIFERMLGHPLIETRLGVDYFPLAGRLPKDCLTIYTGPVDRFFDYKHGRLGWRTLTFEKQVVATADFQGTSVMNEADRAVAYTRTHEFKHFHPERKHESGKTVIFREYSKFARGDEEPYYPINTDEDKARFALYRGEMERRGDVVFGGRLATYKYLDMHQVVGQALVSYEREVKPKLRGVS